MNNYGTEFKMKKNAPDVGLKEKDRLFCLTSSLPLIPPTPITPTHSHPNTDPLGPFSFVLHRFPVSPLVVKRSLKRLELVVQLLVPEVGLHAPRTATRQTHVPNHRQLLGACLDKKIN